MGFRLWGRTELDMTEATLQQKQQQQQQQQQQQWTEGRSSFSVVSICIPVVLPVSQHHTYCQHSFEI